MPPYLFAATYLAQAAIAVIAGCVRHHRARSAVELTPEVPSLAEYPDLKNVAVTVWYGLFAPAKTDPAIVDKLHQALASVVKEPGDRREAQGVEPAAGRAIRRRNSPNSSRREHEKFSALVKAANIKAE